MIRPGDAAVLDQKIPILLANTQILAIAVKQYLTNHGIDASRIETVSYGKERPLDPGHTEEAWATNRNDEFDNLTTNVVLR